ncbi:MAG TPA: NmrA family NAD(P)-binding protein [Microlunatus sp.]|nr:NmrA family NAD(P)-binding protein [Microlunatus sp.]
MRTVLITAATGTVGRRLVPQLAQQGATVRIHDRSQPIEPQLSGIDAVFLACPNLPEQVAYECGVIDAAARAGVRRLVKLSARGAASNSSVAFWDWHARIEQHLAGSGVPAVVLRPGFSMANLLGSLELVRTAGILPLPAGEARVAMIDPNDVATAATAALDQDQALGTYELTGPAAIGFDEVAAALSRSVGREVRYVDVPTEDAVAGMVAGGVPDFAAVQIGNVFAALRDGAQAQVTDDLERLTGRSGGGLGEFLRNELARVA